MSILVTPSTRVLVQGITGAFGARHTQLSLAYGTQIVAGVTPGKGGQRFEEKVPIFDTVADAVKQSGATASAIFVPPPFAADDTLTAEQLKFIEDHGSGVLSEEFYSWLVEESIKTLRKYM